MWTLVLLDLFLIPWTTPQSNEGSDLIRNILYYTNEVFHWWTVCIFIYFMNVATSLLSQWVIFPYKPLTLGSSFPGVPPCGGLGALHEQTAQLVTQESQSAIGWLTANPAQSKKPQQIPKRSWIIRLGQPAGKYNVAEKSPVILILNLCFSPHELSVGLRVSIRCLALGAVGKAATYNTGIP